MRRVHLIISGIVQGVGFRYSIRAKAKLFNIKGWIKNNIDGSVEILAEGSERDIENFLDYCKKGPSLASVKNVSLDFETPKNEFNSFEIIS